MNENTQRWEFEDEHEFLEKLESLMQAGTSADDLEVITPIPVPDVERIMGLKPSRLKFFTLAGGLSGLAAGFAFTIFTVKDWPIITGGKPLISTPTFIIIAFALTILLGALVSFAGFLLLAKLPSAGNIKSPIEHDNRFIILLDGEVQA
jgi:hypothetical protein